MGSLINSFQSFSEATASFAWALSVFGLSQAGKVFKGLPTSDPTASATAAFDATTAAIKHQFDGIDNTIYNAGNTIQQAAIGLTFNLLSPNTFAPKTVLQTSQNVFKWGLGLAAQLIPGGKVGSGGPPVGWGPVNRKDAELFSTD